MTSRSGPSRHERIVLSVDLGTGGPKIGLVSLAGQLVWHDFVAVPTHDLGGGRVEQDAEEWWQIIADATRRAVASRVVAAECIVAVSITGQWASTVPVDAEGHPVAPCVMWMDTTGGAHSRHMLGGLAAGYSPRAAAHWLRRSGAPPSLNGDDPIGHMLHLERDRPEVAGAARWYLEPVDYLSMRFTGKASASPASMTASWLTDTRRPAIVDYDPLLVRLSGVNPDRLPPLRATGSIIGPVKADVAALLGIPATAQVVTGTLDLHSAAVGAGAVFDYEPHMAISTTSWLSCPVPTKKTDIIRQITTVPGLSADRYLLVNNQDTAGRGLEWLRDVLAGPGDRPGYDDLTALAGRAPAGSGGLIFTPWLIGEHSPVADRNARGGFHNLSLSTDRSRLVRAVLEGVAYNSRWLLGAVERFTGRRLEPIRLIGGAAQSDVWCQIVADVLNRRIERVAGPLHANLRGAGLFAGMALGEVQPEEVRALIAVDTTVAPNPAHRGTYDRLFGEFPRLYRSQKGMFARLARP